jgi:TolA-binding protein
LKNSCDIVMLIFKSHFILIMAVLMCVVNLYAQPTDIEIQDNIAKLQSTDIKVKEMAIYWLQSNKIKQAAMKFIDAFRQEKDDRVKYHLLRALGTLCDTTTVPFLCEIVSDNKQKDNYRSDAAYYLGTIGDKKACPTLLQAIVKNRTYLQNASAYALAEIGDESTIPVLEDILKNDKYATVGKNTRSIQGNMEEVLQKTIKIIKTTKDRKIFIPLLAKGLKIYNEAESLYVLKKYTDALNKYNEYINYYESHLANIQEWTIPTKYPEYHYIGFKTSRPIAKKAEIYEDLGQFDQALLCYNSILPLYPYNQWVKFIKQNKNNETEALRLMIKAKRDLYAGRKESSKKSMIELIRKYPNSDLVDEAYFNLAIYTCGLEYDCAGDYGWLGPAGDFKNGIRMYRSVYKKYPASNMADDALLAVGSIYECNGQNDSALYYYNLIIKSYPKASNDLLGWIGGCDDYFCTGTTASIALYREGIIHQKQKNYAKATKSYKRLSLNYPKSPFALSAIYNTCLCYEESGDTNNAINEYKLLSKYCAGKDAKIWAGCILGPDYGDNRAQELMER